MVSALQITDLTKEYPGFKLEHVSFTLPQGTIMGLIGENGAGKSTTINAILDLIKRDEGSVTFWGEELSKNPRQLKEIFMKRLLPSKWERFLQRPTVNGIRLFTKTIWINFSCPPTRKSKPFPKV